MITAINYFNYVKENLSDFKLRLLLNIEDLNNSIFNEVFNILKPHQQEEFITFKESFKRPKSIEKKEMLNYPM